MTHPRAIALDLDNTVYAYAPCHEAGLASAAGAATGMEGRWRTAEGFAADYARARAAVKERTAGLAVSHCRLHYFKEMVETAMGRTDAPATFRLHESYWDGYVPAMKPDPGAVELLRDLRDRGVLLAWVSNFTTERQMLKLRALGLEGVANFVLTSEEAGEEKPSPRVIDLALAKLGVAPSEAWLVGDDEDADIGAARARGMTIVCLRRDGQRSEVAADHVVGSWDEIRRLLDGLR